MATLSVDIQVLTGVSAGDVFHFKLQPGDSIKIGRAEGSEIVLADPRVSRTHCGLLYKEGGLHIYDLGSASGTVHMGFQLQAGDAGARLVSHGDEFKIGDSLFRLSLSSEGSVEVSQPQDAERRILPFASVSKKTATLAAVALALLLLLLFIPGEKKQSLPKQRSQEILSLPANRVLGYWPGGSKVPAQLKDATRIDKVQVSIPAAHVLLEYEYRSEAPVVLSLDQVEVDSLPRFDVGWRRKQLIVRDVAQGSERVLVFDNQDYPRKGSGKKRPLARWAVRNVRVTPLDRAVDASVASLGQAAAALASDIDRTPSGLFLLVRGLQRLALELLIDQTLDAAAVTIVREAAEEGESIALDSESIIDTLHALVAEREKLFDSETAKRHLQAVTSLLAQLDGELWRRTDSRFRQAKFAAQAQNHIVVYDNLMAIKAMFPDESDQRWVRAQRMLMDKKFVPKKVRLNPERYRR